jgi:UDP-glucose 4-epimerase
LLILFGGNGFLGRHTAAMARAMGIGACVVSRNPDVAFLDRHAPGTHALDVSAFNGTAGRDLVQKASAIVYLVGRGTPGTSYTPGFLNAELEPGFELMERLANENPNVRLVYISSGGAVYGDCAEPAGEDQALNPVSLYGLSRAMLEQAVQYYARRFALSFRILRISNPVGRWQVPGAVGLVAHGLARAQDGKPLLIYGDGSAVRDYVDADDVARAIILAAMDETQQSGRIWNVGSGVGHSINAALAMIEEGTGRKINAVFADRRPFDVSRNVLNIQRIEIELGWKPTLGLGDSIKKLWSERVV